MSKYTIRSILFVFVAFMLGCNEYMIVGVLPDIAREFHASLSSLGYIVTLFALVYAISTPIITSLAHHFKRHHLLFGLITIFLFGNTWTAMSSNYYSLLFSRIITACTAGAIISIILIFGNFIAPLNKRASLLSWIFAGFSIASVVGVPLGTMISTNFSWHMSFWLISILTIICLLLLIWLAPRNTDQAAKKSTEKNNQFLLLADRRILFSVIFVVMVCASQYTYYTYIRPLITNEMHFSYSWLNWLLLGLGLASIIGNKVGGLIADRGGMKLLPYIYSVMTLALVLLSVLIHVSWLAYAIAFLLSSLISAYGASTQVFFLDIATQDYPQSLDLASSLNSIFANVGISLGSFTAAQVAGITSITTTGYVGAIYSLIGVLCLVIVCRILHK